jgi:signal peptidase I
VLHDLAVTSEYQGRHFRRRSPLRTAIELPALLLVAILVTLILKAVLAQAFYIPSASMEPQLHINDRVVVSRTSYRLHPVHRGDIVVFPSPAAKAKHHGFVGGIVQDLLDTVALGDRSDDELIKRVIGLPGETVEGKNGKILINGRELVEPYLAEEPVGDFPPKAIPKGQLWVMGDNRNRSSDSRVFGPIKKSKIVGRAILRIWPVTRLGFL